LAREYLFLYGSLLTGSGDRALDRLVSTGCRTLGRGHIHARLYDLGPYPGAVASDKAHERIYGEVFELTKPRHCLPRLDAYEGYLSNAPEHSEYVRAKVPVTLEGSRRTLQAWVYLFNGAVAHRPRIKRGDYLAHRARRRTNQ